MGFIVQWLDNMFSMTDSIAIKPVGRRYIFTAETVLWLVLWFFIIIFVTSLVFPLPDKKRALSSKILSRYYGFLSKEMDTNAHNLQPAIWQIIAFVQGL